ncbi:MAG TPA: hypothetical protein VFI27_10450 [candidate division Zixibacteria bacterium]|nr:hypothetical protein [candidate division Zixibacteria bacterium]
MLKTIAEASPELFHFVEALNPPLNTLRPHHFSQFADDINITQGSRTRPEL